MSDDLNEGLSCIVVDPRVTSRGSTSFLLECLSLSTRFWPDVGATNEIKTLASFLSLPEYVMSDKSASVKIYVEETSNLGRKCVNDHLINRGPS